MPGVAGKPNGTKQSLPPRGRRGSLTSQADFEAEASLVKQSIVVGCPKEVKPSEDRVGIIPGCAAEYIANGHTVVVERNAGEGAGFDDESYKQEGCIIVDTASEVYGASHMIVKVKEPMPSEYGLIREGQVIFTYFHFAANRELTDAMIKQKAVCVAYETVQAKDGSLPLLTPMSEIAGRMSVQEGAKFLEKPMGGLGVLLSGVPGVKPAKVVVLGGGVVGTNAAVIAAGSGADVTVMDINMSRLRYLDDILPKNCNTLYCNTSNLSSELKTADLVVGAVLIPGAKAPKLLKRENVKSMKKGALIVDVAVDQGGCCDTTRMTTHQDPTYVEEGVVHYCVGNMPGAVPMTSTLALNNVTLKYGLELANKGWLGACQENEELAKGLNIVLGAVVYNSVAVAFGIQIESRETVLKENEKAQSAANTLNVQLARLSVH
eukprot:GHVS01031654.1.p1 GENE.GHVS01031654.1~~GHVS01031654.1.p1  ORF type:complete len:434 (+),score=52.93 GHVS01031654.1:116-1417(+)